MRYLAAFAWLSIALHSQTVGLTPAEERGKRIYVNGTSPSGGVIEALLAGETRVVGSVVPCANCHGADGRGKPEGGVVPSNITWEVLTKPYGLTHSDGRTHPAYTEHLLKRAITMGVDPAGNMLGSAMPRFQLSLADASDLSAYVRSIGRSVAAGISANTVRLGLVFPPGRLEGAVRQALLDYFERVNSGGGVFGRRIDLVFAELPSTASQRVGAIRQFLRKEQPFAVLGDFSGAEMGVEAAMRETGTPAISARLDTAAAAVITDGLKIAGRDLTRAALIEAVESSLRVRGNSMRILKFDPVSGPSPQ